jgi:hypothetical protein
VFTGEDIRVEADAVGGAHENEVLAFVEIQESSRGRNHGQAEKKAAAEASAKSH